MYDNAAKHPDIISNKIPSISLTAIKSEVKTENMKSIYKSKLLVIKDNR